MVAEAATERKCQKTGCGLEAGRGGRDARVIEDLRPLSPPTLASPVPALPFPVCGGSPLTFGGSTSVVASGVGRPLSSGLLRGDRDQADVPHGPGVWPTAAPHAAAVRALVVPEEDIGGIGSLRAGMER